MVHQLHPKPLRRRQDQPSQNHAGEAAKTRHRHGANTDLYRKQLCAVVLSRPDGWKRMEKGVRLL